MKNTAVMGIFGQEAQAANAVDALRVAGFRNTDISVLKAPQDPAADAGTGTLLGGALGWLAEAGTLAIPGGPFVASYSPLRSFWHWSL